MKFASTLAWMFKWLEEQGGSIEIVGSALTKED